MFECESSQEFESSFPKIEDKFDRFSAYFIVDENNNEANREKMNVLDTSISEAV